jgi:hypothetical protein
MRESVQAGGFKFRILGWSFRVWRYGFEYGNKFGGCLMFFPWAPIFRERKYR